MFKVNPHKVISALLIFILFVAVSGTASAGSLSKRRASMRSIRRYTRKTTTNRNALSQRGYRQHRNSVNRKSSRDSSVRRAFRSAVKLDARGGGFQNTVGQMMTRDNSNQSRRTGSNWARGAAYTVNAGNAVKYLANQLNHR